MKKCLFTAAFALALGGSSMAQSTNPFLSESYGTPYEIAPFEKITIDNYREAFLKGRTETGNQCYYPKSRSTRLRKHYRCTRPQWRTAY